MCELRILLRNIIKYICVTISNIHTNGKNITFTKYYLNVLKNKNLTAESNAINQKLHCIQIFALPVLTTKNENLKKPSRIWKHHTIFTRLEWKIFSTQKYGVKICIKISKRIKIWNFNNVPDKGNEAVTNLVTPKNKKKKSLKNKICVLRYKKHLRSVNRSAERFWTFAVKVRLWNPGFKFFVFKRKRSIWRAIY